MEQFVSMVDDFVQSGKLGAIIAAVVMLLVTLVIERLIVKLLKRLLNVDGSPIPSSTIIINIVRIVIWGVGISVMLSNCFGIDVNGLVAALGVGGIALSLGLQDTIKNFFGGMQVTFMGIVKPGDHVIVGSAEGIVPWGVTVLLTVTAPSPANRHSVSCMNPADLEPVTSTVKRSASSSIFTCRAWYWSWESPER